MSQAKKKAQTKPKSTKVVEYDPKHNWQLPKRVGRSLLENVALCRQFVNRIAALKRSTAIAKAGYFDVKGPADDKTLEADLKWNQQQMDSVKIMMRDQLGGSYYKVRLNAAATVNATVTSGVVVGTVLVNVNGVTESSTLAVIFEEFRIPAFKLRFLMLQSGVLGSGNMFVLCYDPADTAALTSVVNGMDAQQHKLFPFNTNGNAGTPLLSQNIGHHTFEGKVPLNSILVAGSTVNGSWQPTTTLNANYGIIKVYGAPTAPAIITAVPALDGFLTLETEWRFKQ